MTLRAMGPTSSMLPEATGMLVQYMIDPKSMPYLRYTQLIPAPDVVFSYWRMDPDDPSRLASINEFGWAYGDYRPTGKGFQPRGEMIPATMKRWDFPYSLDNTTARTFQKGTGLDPRSYFDTLRAGHAQLHRAQRVVTELQNTTWGANTATPAAILGAAGAYFDASSGTQFLPSGLPDPNFQVIKRTFLAVKRAIHLATNGALNGSELLMVLPPKVAIAIATSGEMVNYLKGSPFAKDLTDPNIVNWDLPPTYGGFTLVVEDTPRCFIKQNADGTIADVSVSAQKDYILNTDTAYVVSRPGGLMGIPGGGRSYSTVQVWHYNGEARVEAYAEPKHDLVEGHVVMEDKVLVPAIASGFAITDCLA